MNPPMLKSVISLDSWLSPGRGHLGHLLKLIPPGRGDLLKLIPPGRGGLLKLIAHGRGGLLKLIPPGRVIAPFALVLERKVRPKITFPIFMQLFVLGLLGPVIDQNFYYAGLKFTSPTFSCGMSNMLPAMTFVMAVLCSTSTVIHPHLSLRQLLLRTKTGLIKGSILLILATLAWASFFILQPVTIRRYPAHLSLTAIVCFLGTLQSAAVTFVMEHKDSVRTIGWDLNLLAAAYAGIVSSGIAYYVQGLVMQKRGPVFATAFSHLMMIIVAIMGSFLLAEKIYVGGVLGAVLIVIGLYAVLWGKYKEMVPEAVENIEMVLKLWRTRTHFGNN
ncbi:WAT1-related protein [Citrus sinensis]|uniref:WAT1-related protein n=1 Tax=Citrus sinensis TaxID=2711 RepID=A0ACB8K0X0_CITSI|nr:WAT1-related protein [Citrus sinensis]